MNFAVQKTTKIERTVIQYEAGLREKNQEKSREYASPCRAGRRLHHRRDFAGETRQKPAIAPGPIALRTKTAAIYRLSVPGCELLSPF